MDIDIRCEECGEYLEIVKEWTDRNGINITVSPCSELGDAQALADKRLELLKRLEWTPLYFSTLKKIIYTCVVCSQSKEDGHADDCELAEAIDGKV